MSGHIAQVQRTYVMRQKPVSKLLNILVNELSGDLILCLKKTFALHETVRFHI